jgi:hypothetical protein
VSWYRILPWAAMRGLITSWDSVIGRPLICGGAGRVALGVEETSGFTSGHGCSLRDGGDLMIARQAFRHLALRTSGNTRNGQSGWVMALT